MKIIQSNKKAHHDYQLEEKIEAGIVLKGSEIKSIRTGHVSLNEAFISFKGSEAFIINMQIAPYAFSNLFNHEEKRTRKLLMHKSQILKWMGKTKEQGYTVIPVKLYIEKGLAKLEIALAKGKKDYDKREDMKRKDMEMHMKKAIRGKR